MDGRKLVVIEANEVPRRVVVDVAATGRTPFLAALIERGALVETVVDEELPRELYPSQSWASMNTGVTFAEHGVYWYGDPKPDAHPLYWQRAAIAGLSIGLVNTLHSSPIDRQCRNGDYRFVIPDCFSAGHETIPARYSGFQRANTALTGANSRRTSLRPDVVQLARLARAVPTLGTRASTLADIARLVAGVALGRIPRERLRTGQFFVLRDLFLRLLAQESPDLAVLFTNHVAAAMHRYWYAMYPEDFADEHYRWDWVARHRDEVTMAIVALDRFLGEVHRWCVANDRTLIVCSSMGQGPSSRLDTALGHEAVIVDPLRFLQALKIGPDVEVLGSMAPQLTIDCGTADRAAEAAARLDDVDAGQVFWDVDRAAGVVTLTYEIDVVDERTVKIGRSRRLARSVGVEVYPVDDHSSGRHIARGILAVANSPTFKPPTDGLLDYLDYAPAVLRHLGVEPDPHHRLPQFRI